MNGIKAFEFERGRKRALSRFKKEPNNQYIIATLVDFYLNLGKIDQGWNT